MNTNEKRKEELRNMIVPVYGSFQGINTPIGTAFILKSGLVITTAHIFYNSGIRNTCNYEIRLNGKNYLLNIPIFEEFKSDYPLPGEEAYLDLSVFNLQNELIVNSELELSFNLEDWIYMMGYPFADDTLNTTHCDIDIGDYSYKTFSIEPFKRVVFSNCFRVQQFTGEGSSGGPVLSGNRVLGMIVFGHLKSGTTALKSEYIRGKLIELKLM